MGMEINYIVHATSSGGTQTGLTLGNLMIAAKTKVIGITAYVGIKERLMHDILLKAESVCKILDVSLNFESKDFCIIDYFSEDRHATTPDEERIMNAIKLVAKTEGILLDPVYTGKAMATLIDMIKQGRFDEKDNVVFIHTGGTPTLFASSRARLSFLPYTFVRLYNKYGRRYTILRRLASARL